MGGFMTGGGPNPPSAPDIPVPDFKSEGAQLAAGLRNEGVLGWLLSMWGPSFWGFVVFLITQIAAGFDIIMTIWMKLLTTAQNIQSPEFFDLASTMISDLLGVEISSAQMQQSLQAHGAIGGMESVGEAFIKQLVAEFAGGGSLTPESGFKAANAFMGFLLTFSIREANMEFLTSMIPEEVRIGEDFRKYAVDMARNVGLGRLARRVMQAPIQALITTPLTWYYNEKYRPTLFPVGEMFRSYTRGLIDEATLKQQMAYHGLPDAWRDPLITEYSRVPFATQFFYLYQYGQMTQDQVIAAYKSLGYSDATAQLMFDARRFQDANTEVSGMMTNLESMRLKGYIDEPTFRDLVDSLPIAPDRKKFYLNRVGQQLEWPRAKLTLSEMQTAFVDGMIDISDLSDYLKADGYSDNDQYLLLLLTAGKLHSAESKYAATKFAYDQKVAKAQAKGLPVPPPPAGLAIPPA